MSSVRVRYQTIILDDHDYHLRTLKDRQQCPDDLIDSNDKGVSTATWPLFGVLWPAEEFLSTLMLTQNIRDIRILEVGCGIGLASMVLRRRGANITATDYNPDAAEFLAKNTALNELEPIACVCADWQEENPTLGRFDLIIGSDLLYDRHNVEPFVTFLNTHTETDGEILIVDPQRGLTNLFIRRVQSHGFTADVTKMPYPDTGEDTEDYLVIRLRRDGEITSS